MKWVTILIVVWLCSATAEAQKIIEKHLDFSGKESVELKIQIADSINVKTWNKNEVYVKASVDINDNKDNEVYTTSFSETGKTLKVDAGFRGKDLKKDNNCCNKSDIYWEIMLPENAVFNIESIDANVTISGKTGELKVKTISGSIDLSASGKKDADIDLSTISGRVFSDLDLNPEKSQGSIPVRIRGKMNKGGNPVKLETISGDIFLRKAEL